MKLILGSGVGVHISNIIIDKHAKLRQDNTFSLDVIKGVFLSGKY